MASLLKLRRNTSTGIIPTTGATVVGELLANVFDGRIWLRCNNGADYVKEIGAGSSIAQKYLAWDEVSGLAPVQSYEFDAKVYLFSQGQLQSLVAFIHVPSSYSSITPIKLRLGHYSSGVANNFKFTTTTTLIRKGNDAVNSTTNQFASTNTDQAIPTTQYQYLEVIYDLTSPSGQINSVAVSPGDLIKVVLQRVTPTGTEDTSDVRMISGSAEVIFS